LVIGGDQRRQDVALVVPVCSDHSADHASAHALRAGAAQLQLAAAGSGWRFAADATLEAMQRLQNIYSWSADDVRDKLHAYFTVYARALDTVPGDFAHYPT
jgi:hypothetical protein